MSELHTECLLSSGEDVTLTLRTASGEGNAEGKGDSESGVRDWGESGVEEGERGSKIKLWEESFLRWPFPRCIVSRRRNVTQRAKVFELNADEESWTSESRLISLRLSCLCSSRVKSFRRP